MKLMHVRDQVDLLPLQHPLLTMSIQSISSSLKLPKKRPINIQPTKNSQKKLKKASYDDSSIISLEETNFNCPQCQIDLTYLQSSYFRQKHITDCFSTTTISDSTQSVIDEPLTINAYHDKSSFAMDLLCCTFCAKDISWMTNTEISLHLGTCFDSITLDNNSRCNGSKAESSTDVYKSNRIAVLNGCPCCHGKNVYSAEATFKEKAIHIQKCASSRSMSLIQLEKACKDYIIGDAYNRTSDEIDSIDLTRVVKKGIDWSDYEYYRLALALSTPGSTYDKEKLNSPYSKKLLFVFERNAKELANNETMKQKILDELRQKLSHDIQSMCEEVFDWTTKNNTWQEDDIAFACSFFEKIKKGASYTIQKLLGLDNRFSRLFTLQFMRYNSWVSGEVSRRNSIIDLSSVTCEENEDRQIELWDDWSDIHGNTSATSSVVDLTECPNHKSPSINTIDFHNSIVTQYHPSTPTEANQDTSSVNPNTPNAGSVQSDMPDYTILTLPELKNAVKKYGLKPTKRHDMILHLEQIWKSSRETVRLNSVSSSTLLASGENKVNKEILDHLKKQPLLWERILRYENVTVEECHRGLKCKKKLVQEFLDENALSYKSRTLARQ
ncbi:hypothetical protein PHYBLDRAFT_139600 [Phycomyces blakesleeanus NRRL 1555(-)]|uniref:SAP domain-containing protein n=1 Tax=Phycomyces blakesleeanus (strain ATCC 8743b / DSM 1359 / FGSC 10004 / NBRC 33097 / NRRL 1555) TaxID=763407 RepID=A0A162V2T3_PHYB8|nr:hypothetical protein PHYBLDRAFT_139600 [Phycomyces blakesleeanus NRRL 1555(-)]OAD79572.1 hypothetical protein PHYBLDRAFT_139600 [Phycomyces blakesleeanus NRRL 1555(-)]|eukprot:XP_018297612.1 hypothetical protein PHYBLDRAFT_139600 [Phycomyces blakesleeanus NRRL 1555(-)]